MTALAQTATTLTSKGIREDLEDTIYRVAPSKTPFQNNISAGGKATGTYHEWQVEGLDTPSGSNFQLEGDDIGTTFDLENKTTRVGNYCQIFRKTGLVSGTDEVVKKAGRESELNRQKVLKGLALRTDMEMTFLANAGSNAESGATPRKCAGIQAWLVTNVSNSGGGANPGFSGSTVTAATPGTPTRAFSETLLKQVRSTAFGNGATPNQLYVPPTTKQSMSVFTGLAQNRLEIKQGDQVTLVGAVDVYVDDFGAISIIPHQYAMAGAALFIDPNMVSVATLRGIQTETLAQTGDAEKFMILAEKTLVVRNEKAHAIVRALS